MPEMHARLRWPDGSRTRTYSPSLVLAEHLDEGAGYPVDELVERTRAALSEAGERVRARYGVPCSAAAASLDAVETTARRFPEPGARVVVEGFDR